MSALQKPVDFASLSLDEFLGRNRIETTDWEKSGCEWDGLRAIADDHAAHGRTLTDAAEFFGKTIQRFGGVHSVRWRVKDVEHLIEKIVRKRAEGKYEGISVDNYFETVTDLVGIRALHLFKEDCFDIHKELLTQWTPLENQQTAYVRQGDDVEFSERLKAQGFDVNVHHAGYRSLHYVFEIKPTRRAIRAEIQVRTIFEEGWSEIDHTVRYPNFGNNPLVNYFLTIFNRMAGSADEMGGFVRGMTAFLAGQQEVISAIKNERDEAIARVSETAEQMERLVESNGEYKAHAQKLKAQVDALRRPAEAVSKDATMSALAALARGVELPSSGLYGLGKMDPVMHDLNRLAKINPAFLRDLADYSKVDPAAVRAFSDLATLNAGLGSHGIGDTAASAAHRLAAAASNGTEGKRDK